MTNVTKIETPNPMPQENFADLLEESLQGIKAFEGKVVPGKVITIMNGFVLLDVGLKSEGRIPLNEFQAAALEPKVGDTINIYVERLEDRNGEAVLSYEKACREAAWETLERAHEKNERVTGKIIGRIKGGFTVDLSGVIAFLPGSQLDVRPIKDVDPLIDVEQPFQILKMDRLRGNIVVSRRSILEESRAEARSELISNLQEGQKVQGMVKNITDYGAFIDLGGIDGLLHVTDISWQRINHPSDILEIGQNIDVQIIKYNKENQRISLGIKQLEEDPWSIVSQQFEVGKTVSGKITNVTDYGVFVELIKGIEGLIHISELSWTQKNPNPRKLVEPNQEISVKILDVDTSKRRISLSLRECTPNPWMAFEQQNPVNSEMDVKIQNITDFGLFVELNNDLDGLVHISDISWDIPGEEAIKSYKIGDTIKVKILETSPEKERVSLGIKQLSNDPFAEASTEVKAGSVVTVTVKAVHDNGLDVQLSNGIKGFIKKADLSRERSEQKPDRFAVEERIDAMVSSIDRKNRRINLSIKAYELKEEKEAMEEYGSSDSGASLGDILGVDLEKVKEKSIKNTTNKQNTDA